MIKKTKRSFTLLELLICLTLLSLVGSLFAIQGKQLFERYFFTQETAKLRDVLQLAKEYACCYQCDIEVAFAKSGSSWLLKIQTDEPLLKQEALFLKPVRLSKIENIDLQASHILFSGSGWVFPQDKLTVIGKKQKKVVIQL